MVRESRSHALSGNACPAAPRPSSLLTWRSVMLGLNFQELLIIGVAGVLLFAKNLPDIAKHLGRIYRDL